MFWSQRPPLLWWSPQGLCKTPHDTGICWKQFMMRLGNTGFIAALHSTPMHDPGPEEFQRPVGVCVCRGAGELPCLLSCCCWRRRPHAVRRSRLRAAPPPGACPPGCYRTKDLPMAKGGVVISEFLPLPGSLRLWQCVPPYPRRHCRQRLHLRSEFQPTLNASGGG